jgi:putative transposase
MKEADMEMILERAKEKYPEAKPRIISDNGPQFIARDFKEFIRISGMTHVRTSPFYPQSKDYASHCTSLIQSGVTWPAIDL